MRISISDAAQIAADSYNDGATHLAGRRIEAILRGDAAAVMLKGDILVVRGSDSVRDYLKYNVRPLLFGKRRMTLRHASAARGTSGTVWHQGFLEHAREVQRFVGLLRRKPSLIIGHSLGAATTQILSLGYNVPGIGFAPPRVCMHKVSSAQDQKCLLICRNDDIVTQIPAGFRHLGSVYMLNLPPKVGHAHAMLSYQSLLDQDKIAGHVPKHWPAST